MTHEVRFTIRKMRQPRHLYASFGFVPNGEKDSDYEDAEEVAVLPLK